MTIDSQSIFKQYDDFSENNFQYYDFQTDDAIPYPYPNSLYQTPDSSDQMDVAAIAKLEDSTPDLSSISSDLSDHAKVSEQTKLQPGIWSETDIQNLKKLRKKHGPNWVTIASLIKNKKASQCNDKWRSIWTQMSAEEKLEYEITWTCEEDTQLMDLVKSYGKDWEVITPFFSNKNPIACENHWNMRIFPQIPKEHRYEYKDINAWTKKEKQLLSELVSLHGPNWDKISSIIIEKSAKQCELKWRFLKPRSSSVIWTPEQIQRLLELVIQHKTKWKVIAPLLEKTPKQCESKWRSLYPSLQDKEKLERYLKRPINMKLARRKTYQTS